MLEKDIDIKIEKSNKSRKNKKSCITFAKLNKYFLFPILCPLFNMISNYFLDNIIQSRIVKKEFIYIIFNELIYITVGLLFFISCINKKINSHTESNGYKNLSRNDLYYLYLLSESKIKKRIIIIFILLILLFTIYEVSHLLNIDKHTFDTRLLFIFFIPIFNKIILKEKIYKHQYLSLLISCIGIMLLIIPTCLILGQDDIMANILNFVGGLCFSLFFVLIKSLTHLYNVSPFKISLSFGLLTITYTTLLFAIYSLVKYHDLSYFKDCIDFSNIENKIYIIVYIILSFIFGIFYQLFVFLVIFYFSPIFLITTEIIGPLFLWIEKIIIFGISMPDIILYPFGFFITIFSTLIYNDIIVLNFCGFNKNIKIFVEQKHNDELLNSRKDEDEINFGSD